jgi:arginine N-succinyltransferase
MNGRVGEDLVMRMARLADAGPLHALALAHGAGLTNLPQDEAGFARRIEAGLDELTQDHRETPLTLVPEARGHILGTSCIFPRIGATWPFYSYRINRLSQCSRQANRSVAFDILTLTNDLDGHAEVGGLLVHPDLRRCGAGRLAARSRYLFMAAHRSMYGDRVIAELRGWLDETGASPVWEALGRRFYHMGFEEADRMSGEAGGQFIADLGPRYPIYANLLPPEAQAALGRPHAVSRAAFDLLIQEGFRYDGYVDIFDGGPTVVADIDTLKGVRDSRLRHVTEIREPDETFGDELVAYGLGEAFRAAHGRALASEEEFVLSPALAGVLGVSVGDEVRHVAF